jgi:hypothetical protein
MLPKYNDDRLMKLTATDGVMDTTDVAEERKANQN